MRRNRIVNTTLRLVPCSAPEKLDETAGAAHARSPGAQHGLIYECNSDEMTDDADTGAHSPPLRAARAAMHSMAGLTGLAESQVAKGLKDRHGRDRTGMAFIADMGLDLDQHGGFSLVPRVTVKTRELLRLTFKPHAGIQRVLVMGVDGLAAE
jgi:hypothetical protein